MVEFLCTLLDKAEFHVPILQLCIFCNNTYLHLLCVVFSGLLKYVIY